MLRSPFNFVFTGSLRRAVALLLLPAAALLFMVPAMAGDEVVRKVQIKVIADAGGEAVELDLSDLQVGETRWITSDSGKEIGITREENGYRLDIDGEETFIMSPGDGMHKRIMVHATTDGEGDDLHSVMSNVWVTDDAQVLHLDGMAGGGMFIANDSVFISGLGDLDEYQKADIIDALRSAGVEKEIHFAPSGGPHMMSFTIDSDVHADGEHTVDIQVLREQLLGEAGDADGSHVIIIQKKIMTTDEDDN